MGALSRGWWMCVGCTKPKIKKRLTRPTVDYVTDNVLYVQQGPPTAMLLQTTPGKAQGRGDSVSLLTVTYVVCLCRFGMQGRLHTGASPNLPLSPALLLSSFGGSDGRFDPLYVLTERPWLDPGCEVVMIPPESYLILSRDQPLRVSFASPRRLRQPVCVNLLYRVIRNFVRIPRNIQTEREKRRAPAQAYLLLSRARQMRNNRLRTGCTHAVGGHPSAGLVLYKRAVQAAVCIAELAPAQHCLSRSRTGLVRFCQYTPRCMYSLPILLADRSSAARDGWWCLGVQQPACTLLSSCRTLLPHPPPLRLRPAERYAEKEHLPGVPGAYNSMSCIPWRCIICSTRRETPQTTAVFCFYLPVLDPAHDSSSFFLLPLDLRCCSLFREYIFPNIPDLLSRPQKVRCFFPDPGSLT